MKRSTHLQSDHILLRGKLYKTWSCLLILYFFGGVNTWSCLLKFMKKTLKENNIFFL